MKRVPKYKRTAPSDNREYHWARKLRNRYGMTVADYNALLAKQSGKCALCGKEPQPRQSDGVALLDVDHDHESGHIRGLLCRSCNVGLGLLDDSPELMLRAVRYLWQRVP